MRLIFGNRVQLVLDIRPSQPLCCPISGLGLGPGGPLGACSSASLERALCGCCRRGVGGIRFQAPEPQFRRGGGGAPGRRGPVAPPRVHCGPALPRAVRHPPGMPSSSSLPASSAAHMRPQQSSAGESRNSQAPTNHPALYSLCLVLSLSHPCTELAVHLVGNACHVLCSTFPVERCFWPAS